MPTIFAEAPPFSPNFSKPFEYPQDPFPEQVALDIQDAKMIQDAEGSWLPFFRPDDRSPFVPAVPGTLFYDSAKGGSATPEACSSYIDTRGYWCAAEKRADSQLYWFLDVDSNGILFIKDPAIRDRFSRVHDRTVVPDHVPGEWQDDQPSADAYDISLTRSNEGQYSWPDAQLVATPEGYALAIHSEGEPDWIKIGFDRDQPSTVEAAPTASTIDSDAGEPFRLSGDMEQRPLSGEQLASTRDTRIGRRILATLRGKGTRKKGE